MNKFSKLVVVVSIFLLLSFSLLFVTFSKGLQVPYLNNIVRVVVTPIQSVISVPTRFFSEQKDVLTDLMNAYEENKQLKETIMSLEGMAAENTSLKEENASLRSSLGVVSDFPEKQLIPGSVLVRTPSSWSEHISINIGETSGVTYNALVVANGGLVGIVSSLSSDSAVVTLFTNSDEFTKLPVKISVDSKEIYGILSGYDADTNSFIINQLNSADEIAVGSNVVTSDLAGETPANVQIGKVLSVKSNSNSLNREVYVEPTASFSNIYSVLVVGQTNAQ
ncbi:TPA: rod shape-determining protein MreC [Streptococcus suis]|uniref:Cell shape-determining protein MreC n=1 Tax=Streptococcus suis (strain GZ1) TaxID=423211 RepID=D5AF67_STRGZ|nr:rod shape-determining protein MreC [Streptococcus suis]ABP88991.1 putative cell shape-determining protein MreC [Streptococcus suis 05ZYH33]ABP91182.1 putative cell shape-determining protein MreC [Streptococcus suis 98HAH33]MCY0529660.1 rod shape-determining protein MreC [Klebsiella pneumoniae]ADE30482.1 putative cell shape-determining protein MreC [Streptococcus suis GZ1]ADV69131.1 rod shape-determining protein MreC [Streptococcus suis JS14]